MHAQELLATAAAVAAEEPRAAWLGGLTNHEDAFLRFYRMLLALHASVAAIPHSVPRSSGLCTASASAGRDCIHNLTPERVAGATAAPDCGGSVSGAHAAEAGSRDPPAWAARIGAQLQQAGGWLLRAPMQPLLGNLLAQVPDTLTV